MGKAKTTKGGARVLPGLEAALADPAAAAAGAGDKIAAARVWLLKEKPFFGVLARALRVEPSLDVAVLRLTADDRLLFHPVAVLRASFPSLCARLAHVALHAGLGALPRRGAREPLRWNLAHDLAVEPLLRAAGLGVLPPGVGSELGAAFDAPHGASAEQRYLLLPEGARPDDAWCDLAEPPPRDDPAPVAGTFTRQDGDEGEEGSGGGGEGESAGRGEPPGDQESDRAGAPREAAGGPPPGEGHVPPVEARSRELAWKMRLGAALEQERASGGKSFGEIPAWIDDLVRATIEPPPDWTAVLQRSVALLTRTGRSYLRPSRRASALVGADGLWPDVVAMPGRRVIPAGRIVAVIDTSASIDESTLARFLGALAAAATAEGFDEVRLVQADAEVTRDEVVLAAELTFREIAVTGRGGTDFGPPLRALAEESRRSGERFTVVYLTDLDGPLPPAAAVRPLDVLWVTCGAPRRRPGFGVVVAMPPATPR